MSVGGRHHCPIPLRMVLPKEGVGDKGRWEQKRKGEHEEGGEGLEFSKVKENKDKEVKVRGNEIKFPKAQGGHGPRLTHFQALADIPAFLKISLTFWL